MDFVVQNDLIAAVWAAIDEGADEGDVQDVVYQAFQAYTPNNLSGIHP